MSTLKIFIYLSFVLDILSKVQTADEVIIDTSTGEWHLPSGKDDTYSIGAFQHMDKTLNTITEDVDEEEEMLARRVNKRAREVIGSVTTFDLTSDNPRADAMTPGSPSKRRALPFVAGSSVSSAIVID